ncbi:MAG: ribonuclease H-like domain-containing protein [bacterium]
MPERAYLDIETSYSGEITIVGIFRPPDTLIQLKFPEISRAALLEALDGTDEIVTFWGHRFDLPVIDRVLGVNLRDFYESRDLADHCHRHGLYGGLKIVEQVLGIGRQVGGITGADAMRLWAEWEAGCDESLATLLTYNEDDVVNLYSLEKELLKLDIDCETQSRGGLR